ncbi:uncharacterized protein HD556DRAFT_1490842 [Suillus plorans]|uniref:Uncharacterized protein n=1 Tax=Suillus plorans TaxID=116603 RepID=A0A9P7DF37_9AGAM|nr:uncharacterized protein HD556DRAFT_1490842 [Suillus plorans]KAG1790324.1 hypothetical protein HD556DRAFT_1490842 [Suillus plorans]
MSMDGGCHLFDHIGNPNGAEGLELEDDPGQPLHDLGADESHIPASIECLSHSPSPQLHDVSSVVPVVEAHIEHPPDDLQAMKPTRAQTVPARNHTSPENGPRYHMQIPEVFTAQLAETSKCEKEQCQCHADEIKAQNHAWYHTVVYSWVKDSGQPNVFEFQSGTPSFTWPHLSLNHQVISLMGLAAARVNEGPDYLITVIEGQLVLLKNPNPRHTQDDAKMSASPSELEVKALLLSKGKVHIVPQQVWTPAHLILIVWPGDFYACDIAKGFRLCKMISKCCQGVAKVFQKMFGVPYTSTTFHVHKRRWADAPANITDRFVKAGRTKDGLWSKFMTETRS